jgi:hypothetical protein
VDKLKLQRCVKSGWREEFAKSLKRFFHVWWTWGSQILEHRERAYL